MVKTFDESWKIDTMDKLILKISNPKNVYVQNRLNEWIEKSESYANMMIEKYGNPKEKYWSLKTLYMFNKIFPNLKHNFKAPKWTPKPETIDEWNFENMRYTYENSQIFGLEYNEKNFKILESLKF